MVSKGLFEEDLLCSPKTKDELAEREAGKSGRRCLQGTKEARQDSPRKERRMLGETLVI